MAIYKTTPEDFKIFQEEVAKWQKRFGLLGWQINTRHQNLRNRAECWTRMQGRLASIVLGKIFQNYDEPPGEKEIRRTAFHEVCELLLARLQTHAEARNTLPGEIEEAKHEIIRILEHVLFEAEYEAEVKDRPPPAPQ